MGTHLNAIFDAQGAKNINLFFIYVEKSIF